MSDKCLTGHAGEVYRAKRNSYGHRKKYWKQGDTFIANEGEIIPNHFELFNKSKPEPDKPEGKGGLLQKNSK